MTETPSAPTPSSPPPQTTPPATPPAVELEPNSEARTMAMLCHLLAIFTWFIGPLVIWLMKKDQMPFVNDQGKEALNWQITFSIAMVIAWLSMFICIGVVLAPAVGVVNLVFCILATVKANSGIRYRYPFAIRLIK